MSRSKYFEKHNLKRIQLDLPEDTRDKLKALSSEFGVPQSQLVALLLEIGFEAIKAGDISLEKYLEPASSPLFQNVVNLDKLQQ